MAKKPEGTFLTSCGAGTCSPAPVILGPPPARCRGADSRARHGTSDWCRPSLKWYVLPNCHCEGASRPWQSHAPTSEFAEVALLSHPGPARLPRRFAPRNDTSGWRAAHQCPYAVEFPPYRAVTTRKGHAASVRRQSRQRLRSDRRYTPYFGIFRFNDGWYGATVPSRDCHGPFGASQ